MKNWKSGISMFAVVFCVAVYIGIFIGRTSSVNTMFVPAYLTSESVTTQEPLTVDLNSASSDDLLAVAGISNQIAKNIISYRKENGNFVSVLELLRVDGITYELYEQIKPYLTIGGS